jgi:uncharacterized membrane protein
MQPSVHQEKLTPIRWGVIIKVVLAVCAAVFVVFLVWYVSSVMIPAHNRAQQQRAFESAELQFLVARVYQIQTFIHLH